MGEYKRQLLSLSLSLSLSVRACVRESECARARRYRGKPENNRPYTGSNLVRDTGYPKVSRGFPHSLHLNTRKLPETCHGRFLPSIFRTPSAAATLEPETTQHNTQQSGQTPDKAAEIKHITLYVSGYTETDPTGMLSPPTVWRQQSEFTSNRQSGQIPAAVCIGFECCCNGQRYKNYYNRDLKPKLWDEIGEKLNVVGKYWNNNTNEIGYCLLIYIWYL